MNQLARSHGRQRWTTADIPDQSGRVAVVTGANTGLGYCTAAALADKGAHVVLAVRSIAKGKQAAARIRARAQHASVEVRHLDLASLATVRRAAEEIKTAHPQIDLLVNNAGVVYPDKRRTENGFELQFGTNHLGHFALTGCLLEQLLATEGSRVVTVSSVTHRIMARLDLEDLHWERRRYNRFAAYAQSKLANLLFTYELQRRLALAGATTTALAAHPGGSNTEGSRHLHPLLKPLVDALWVPLISQPAEMGALPTLRAATDLAAAGGQFYGPDGLGEQRGNPHLVRSSKQSHDPQLQRRLWETSQTLTGVAYLGRSEGEAR